MSRDLRREALEEYERDLHRLESEQDVLKARLAELKDELTLIRKAVETQRLIVGRFPSRSPEDDPSAAAAEEPVGVTDEEHRFNVLTIPAGGSRREQVTALLSQDPARWWKTREVGELLEIKNLKSLRVTMTKMVDQGDLVKLNRTPADSWYRFNDGMVRPGPEDESIQGATM
jgi:hypothetical protein